MVIKKLLLSLLLPVFTFITCAQDLNKYSGYNILWISCEDIGPILGCYGAEGISTPNLDRLAEEGILYENAYSTVGVCAPSRFSIITGTYAIRYGAQNMRTGNHWGFKDPEEEAYLSYIKVKDKTGRNVPQYSVVLPEQIKCFTEYLREAGFYTTNNQKCDYQFNCPLTAWDEVSNNATYLNCPDGMPFFSVFNMEVTHESRIWLKKDDPMLADSSLVRVPAYYPDIPVVRKDISRKYSNIIELDAQVGKMLENLEEEGLLDKTIIFFWSDHGGPLLRQKRAVGNSGLQVPLIVRFPDGKDAGKRVKEIVSLMDLGPTVLSIAGIKPPRYMDGKAFLGQHAEVAGHKYAFGSADRFDEYTGMSRSVIDGRYVYIRNFMPWLPYTYRLTYREQIEMTATLIEMSEASELRGDAAYIWMDQLPVEELYDLYNDPDEINNLVDDPAYHDKLMELREALGKWQMETGDKGFIPEHDLINMMWPGMIQPVTEMVGFIEKGDGFLELKCATEGASIAYQAGNEIGGDHWNLYHKPLKLSKAQQIVARAVRIGYKTSEPTTYTPR